MASGGRLVLGLPPNAIAVAGATNELTQKEIFKLHQTPTLNRKELTAFLSNKMETSVSYFWALCHGIALHF